MEALAFTSSNPTMGPFFRTENHFEIYFDCVETKEFESTVILHCYLRYC
jgi:hypothetical protein